jgi:hypothetical protein
MPKYNPTPNDMYETTPCFICGNYTIDNSETCGNWICEEQMKIFKADYEQSIYEWNMDYERDGR